MRAAMREARSLCLLVLASAVVVSPFSSACSSQAWNRAAYGRARLLAAKAKATTATAKASSSWQLDFYSRPVQGADGKKLWELLVTDDSGSFRHVEAVPSNCINSRELRSRVQRVIDDAEVLGQGTGAA